MSVLGLVLAGGQSTRFGSDKALAALDGQTLLARAVATLGQWCSKVVIAGRNDGPARDLAECIPDWPRAGMGPLGGIAAGLTHAEAHGYASVLTCGVDSAGLPGDLLADLSPPSAYLAQQPVIGHWATGTAPAVRALLDSEERHSMMAFAARVEARAVTATTTPANINTPADLAALEHK